MALIYQGLQSQLENKQGEKTWHLSLVKTGEVVSTQELGEKIAEKSSLTAGDVHNVVRNLMSVMREELLSSRSVKLDGLGTFTMRARTRGTGVATEKEVNPTQITSLHCQFTPEYHRVAGATTRAITAGVKFVHINQLAKNLLSGADDNNNGGNNDDDDFIDPEA